MSNGTGAEAATITGLDRVGGAFASVRDWLVRFSENRMAVAGLLFVSFRRSPTTTPMKWT